MRSIDIQVNGAYGVDFNDDDLTKPAFLDACEKLASSGVELFFPTLITAPIDVLCQRIAKIAGWIQEESQEKIHVGGLHIEGPLFRPSQGIAERTLWKRSSQCNSRHSSGSWKLAAA